MYENKIQKLYCLRTRLERKRISPRQRRVRVPMACVPKTRTAEKEEFSFKRYPGLAALGIMVSLVAAVFTAIAIIPHTIRQRGLSIGAEWIVVVLAGMAGWMVYGRVVRWLYERQWR